MVRKVAGLVPVRKNKNDEWEVLLVRSRWTEEVWLFPKGGVEKNESSKVSAIRETREEAGVLGRVGPKLGKFLNKQGEDQKMWILFVTEILDEDNKFYKEGGKRERQWFTLLEARRVMKDDLKKKYRREELINILDKTEKKLRKIDKKELNENDDDESDDDGSDSHSNVDLFVGSPATEGKIATG